MANWFNVPNALTLLRIVMVGFMPGLFQSERYIAALVLFLAAGATDLLDGYIARRYHLITTFGKLMDPLADKLMLVVTLLLFALRGWTSWIILSLVVAKELVMVVASALLYKKQTVAYSNFWGKAATLLFTVAVVLTFLHDRVYPADSIVMWLAFALSIVAMGSYGLKFIVRHRQ